MNVASKRKGKQVAVGIFRGHGALTRAGVGCARGLLNVTYRAFCLLPRRNEVLFFSRATNEPSQDFLDLGQSFQQQGLAPTFLTRKLSVRSAVPYIGLVVRELYHLARCKVCVIDRYDPIVSLLELEGCDVPSEGGLATQGTPPTSTFSHFPTRPLVIQVWHAFGSFKKFGYQTLATRESHSPEVAALFRIHRNCSWVVCSGEPARAAFAQALNVPLERVMALPRPEYFRLKELRGEAEAQTTPGSILFAPTLRKDPTSAHPLRALYQSNDWHCLEDAGHKVTWAFHPLEETGTAATDVSEALLAADFVVTDYSSIAYEASLLGKRVVFYTPDIAEYAATPGLNDDPTQLCPSLCFEAPDELFAALEGFASGSRPYPHQEFEHFAARAFEGAPEDPHAITRFALQQLDLLEQIDHLERS